MYYYTDSSTVCQGNSYLFFVLFRFYLWGFVGEMSRVVWDSSLSCVVIWVFVRGCERGFGKVIACGKTTTLHPVLLTI